MANRPLAAILTLGCKLNLADSEAIARGLHAAGFDTVDRLCEADAYVVNTCSVTHVADQKSRRLIRSVRRMAPASAVTVTGCFPQSAGFDAAEALGADLVVGTKDGDRSRLVEFLGARRDVPTFDHEMVPLTTGGALHTRAFIRAQEGCNDVCAFCIVPRTRGREASRVPGDVVRDINVAAEAGAREVVITGTQLGAWGRDFETPLRPHHLIGAVLERTEVPRVRFSSLQPQDITPELLALWQDPRLMPHFHFALQSGSEAVLARMRRRYTAREYLDAAARIYAAVPGAAITTDVIAGFPGETEAMFAETLALCREAKFARMHCFPYSQRARTAAAKMPEQVAPEVRKERMARLLALAEDLSVRYRRAALGQVRPVLWENEREDVDGRSWYGHTDTYIPVYGEGEALANRVTPVRLGEIHRDGVRGDAPGQAG